MDPASIIGITSAVISFVDFIGKAVTTARELSDAGTIDEYERLATLTTTLQSGIASLEKRQETSHGHLSDEEKSALQVAKQCKQIGVSIQRLVGKMRAPEPTCPATSKQQISMADKLLDKVTRAAKTGRVALFVLWKKQEADDLRKEFDSCTIQLNAHLIRMASSDVAEKLDNLLTKQLPQLSKDVGLVQTKLGHISRDQAPFSRTLTAFDKKFDQMSEKFLLQLEKVRKALEVSDLTLHAINHRRILNAIRFKEISVRYDQVSRAEKDTFGWLVEGDSVPSHYNLEISFRDWLATGTGIFHFSGKPGSGKSTLMKFLAKHSETASQLKLWQGDRKLVLATAFLWKAGAKKQRSMDGIVRSLLYTILDNYREDLIPKVFPQHWSPNSWSPWTPAEYMEAIGSVFFLDGVDEFEDAEIRKRELASTLLRWTSSNPENVKICVSSREEPVFIDLFPLGQRIRLHLVTAGDIRKAIQGVLGKHENFLKFPLAERGDFIERFVRDSEGVFIWTKLVLDELWNKLDDKQPLEHLHSVLDVVPRDLDEFYERILRSIRTSDAAESSAIFNILVTARAEWTDPACLLVLDYSFIRDFIGPNLTRPAAVGSSQNTPGQGRKAQIRQIRARTQAFKDRAQSLFRGMVEVTNTLSHARIDDYRLDESLTFTHRSVYDFLRRRQGKNHRPSIDVKSLVLHCLMARVRCGWGLTGWKPSVCQMVSSLIAILPWIEDTACLPDRISYFRSLAEMDNVLVQKQLGQDLKDRLQFAVNILDYEIRYPLPLKSDKLVVSVFNVACWMGLHDYLKWVIQWPDSWVWKETIRIPLLESLCWIEQRFRRDGALVPLIQPLLQNGPYANVLDEHQSPWGTCLTLSIMSADIFRARGPS
ncbi:p-loop containing nucleoside triphosphate hydrolase [Fusarium albosuccineum]|uniref:p-loop containing nucleoside triphosphate hydrolase n=1 Tax=Fusarium albosuccineum TaxID=1237068 RepID=A0A8H4LA87_9HYPO|nr:p-loop containing nucleoside triphosphate hydrolase [Fusarium albosuccineum]